MDGSAGGADSRPALASRLSQLTARLFGRLGYLRFDSIPLRARFAIFGAGVVAATVIVFAVAVYLLVESNLYAQQDAQLRLRGQALWRQLQGGDIPGGPGQGRFFGRFELRSSPDTFVEILDSDGAPGLSTATVNGAPPEIPLSIVRSSSISQGTIDNVQLGSDLVIRVYVQRFSNPALGISGYVVAGQPATGIANELNKLRLFLIGGALLSLMAALALAWLLARRALRPIEDVARTAEEIGRTQDLSRRLPAQPTHDEVGRLQASFNQMLQQLEDAYRRLQSALAAQRRFVADASHELRTPLTSIRGNVGFLLRQPDVKSGDRQAALEDIASESERMSRMVQDLLTLARADAGQHLERSAIDLHPLVADVIRQAQPLQGGRRLELEDGIPAPVIGNADALKQLCWILVDNALKHTREDGRIAVRLAPNGSRAELSVSDDGPGIPDGELDRIFERFYQADPARAGEGTGLGLAIARWIVREHEGLIEARNNDQGGATFRVTLPLARPQATAKGA